MTSITEWLARIPEANALIKAILEVAYVGEFGLEADDQSVFNSFRLIDSKPPRLFACLASLTNASTYVQGAIRSPHVWQKRSLDSS